MFLECVTKKDGKKKRRVSLLIFFQGKYIFLKGEKKKNEIQNSIDCFFSPLFLCQVEWDDWMARLVAHPSCEMFFHHGLSVLFFSIHKRNWGISIASSVCAFSHLNDFAADRKNGADQQQNKREKDGAPSCEMCQIQLVSGVIFGGKKRDTISSNVSDIPKRPHDTHKLPNWSNRN